MRGSAIQHGLFLSLLLAACGGATDGGTGSIAVRLVTTGPQPDPDGYVLELDNGRTVPVPDGEATIVAGLARGAHRVRIGGMAPNCWADQYRVDVTVTGDAPAEATIAVTCPVAVAPGLLYWASYFQGPAGLFRADSSGQVPAQPLLPFPPGMNTHPLFSPGGTRIAFSNALAELVVSDPTGGNAVNLTTRSGFHGYPVLWAPDGRKVLFTDAQDGSLRIQNADGTDPRRLVLPKGSAALAWSGDGRYLVLTRVVQANAGQGAAGLYLDRHDLTNGATTALYRDGTSSSVNSAAFTPDGSAVLFDLYTSATPSAGRIYRVPATGGVALPFLAGFKGRVSAIRFSADGTRLGILADSGYVGQVHVATAGGIGLRQLTSTQSWGPYWTQ